MYIHWSVYIGAWRGPHTDTRERIIAAASKLFYSDGIRGVSVDAVADKAGLTKRTLYYHFRSKDDLVAAYLAARDQPNLTLFPRWFAETEGGLPDKIEGIFRNLARSARHPKWKGCGFLRTSAELANMPGHPAIKIGAAHKKKFENWLRATFEAEGIGEGSRLGPADTAAAGRIIRRRSAASRSLLYGDGRRSGPFADGGGASVQRKRQTR